MLKARGLNVFYGDVHVLFDIDLRIDDGELYLSSGQTPLGRAHSCGRSPDF